MRRYVFPAVTALVGVVAMLWLLLGRAVVEHPPSPLLRTLFLLPPVAVALSLAWLGRGNTLTRAPWWRLLVAGYWIFTTGCVARDTSIVSGLSTRYVLVDILILLGLVSITLALVLWERAHGHGTGLERALDLGMVAVSLLCVGWCCSVRPHLASPLGLREGLDILVIASSLVLLASALVAVASGTLRTPTGWWAIASGTAYALGCVWDHPAPVGGEHPLAAYICWSLAGLFVAAGASELVRHGVEPPAGGRRRWRPVWTAVVCLVPLALYLSEASSLLGDGHGVPDATVIGLAVVALSVGCTVRVQLAVRQAASLRRRLEGMARSDHLTGLANRRTAEGELGRAMTRAASETGALTVAVLDLDHFKDFNDQYGHHAGDELLVGAARAWQGCLGAGQLLARLGGEEFLVVAPGLPPSGLAELVDRMRSLTPRGQSFSAGIATWDGHEDGAALVARADGALYEAKSTGRARTCVAYSADALGVS